MRRQQQQQQQLLASTVDDQSSRFANAKSDHSTEKNSARVNAFACGPENSHFFS